MRGSVPALVLVASLLLAGCLAGPSASAPDGSPTASPPATPAEGSPTDPYRTTTPAGSTPTPEPASVEYVVRAGEVPDEFASVTVTFRVVLVDRPTDLGPCYPEVFTGPYKPSITPLATPAGDCRRSDAIAVDLTEVDGERSLGSFEARSARGHALIVADVRATYANGTTVAGIRGTGGLELVRSERRPDGSYGVEVGLEPAEERLDYDYWLVAERFEPADE